MIEISFQSAEHPLPAPNGGRRVSRFRAPFGETLEVLDRELRALSARNVVVIADMPREMIRHDGWPRSTATPKSPGVTVTFRCTHGEMRYDCGQFDDWRDNLRAFALTLEHLRSVDRYGCARGEQYAGWRALPPGAGGPGVGSEYKDAAGAAALLLRFAGIEATPAEVRMMLNIPARRKQVFRAAAMATHPDRGGSAGDFSRANAAAKFIEVAPGVVR